MSMEWFRDLVIVIFGLGATVAVVIFVVMAFVLFYRIRPILDSIRATTKTVENLSHSVEEEVAKPLAQVISFIQGIRQATGLFSMFTRKKEDD